MIKMWEKSFDVLKGLDEVFEKKKKAGQQKIC